MRPRRSRAVPHRRPSSTAGVCHHDCPDACAWTVTQQNGKLVKIEADKHHPFTRGELCSRMDHYLDDVVNNPERLLYPLRRTGKKGEDRFERVSWDQALDDVSKRLKGVIAEHGPSAILPYSFAAKVSFKAVRWTAGSLHALEPRGSTGISAATPGPRD